LRRPGYRDARKLILNDQKRTSTSMATECGSRKTCTASAVRPASIEHFNVEGEHHET
jgi:hypothetical protein